MLCFIFRKNPAVTTVWVSAFLLVFLRGVLEKAGG
jgi:hypothetical protein